MTGHLFQAMMKILDQLLSTNQARTQSLDLREISFKQKALAEIMDIIISARFMDITFSNYGYPQ